MNPAEDAGQAAARGDHAQALQLWRDIQARRPGNRAAASGIVSAVVGLNRPGLAQDLLAEIRAHPDPGIAQFMLFSACRAAPGNAALAVAHCETLEQRGETLAAQRRWNQLRQQHPKFAPAHLGYIRNVLDQGCLTEAERAAAAALKRLPSPGRELHAMRAIIAERAGRWSVAAERWALLAAQAPGYPNARERERENLVRAEQRAPPPAGAPAAPLAVPQIDLNDPVLHDLVTGFESLGYNCEFGLFQRACGANPLGLLRFANSRKPMLLHLLNTRFAGIGEEADNEIVVGRIDYWLRHKPSGWSTHTHKRPAEHEAEAVLKMMLRHTAFLRDKLIDELGQSEKIFVYELPLMTDDDANEIFEALQAYGPNQLLCVRLCTDTKPAGHVDWPHQRLMIANIDREFMNDRHDISFDYWTYFCRLAAARRDLLRPAAP